MRIHISIKICIVLISFTTATLSANNRIQIKDTVISINSTDKLVFTSYNTQFRLWYNPVLEKAGKRIKIQEYNNTNGSELSISISPNKKYVLFDEISKGYIYISDKDSILEENSFCNVLDVDRSCIVYRSQSDCSGEWNDKNQLVSNGEILFKPLTPVNANSNSNSSGKLVEDVHSKAIQLYKQGKKKDAGLAVKTFLQKNAVQNINNNIDKYNDLGFFLCEAGYYKESIPVLAKVIAAVPSRTVAYLNLADAYAGLGDKVNARKNYQIYIDQMKKNGKAAKIPARVLSAVK